MCVWRVEGGGSGGGMKGGVPLREGDPPIYTYLRSLSVSKSGVLVLL